MLALNSIWVVLYIRVPFGVPFTMVPYYIIGDLKREPNLENHPIAVTEARHTRPVFTAPVALDFHLRSSMDDWI